MHGSHLRWPVLAATALLVGAVTATAGSGTSRGSWQQITHQHQGARSNLGLARGNDGKLHVLWAGPNRAPFASILDTVISPAGKPAKPQTVLAGWSGGVNPPTAAAARDGSVHAIVSGAKVGGQNDPTDGLNEVVGPGTWKVGPRAFGNATLTEASNADVHTAFLKNGQLVSVWQSAAALLFEVGTDPNVPPQNITPSTLAVNPVLAVDARTGDAVIAYHGVNDGQNYFRRIVPALGPPQAIPGSKGDGPTIAARAGGGVFTAFVAGARVVLLQYRGKARTVPQPKGARALVAGVAAGPDGRLWVYYGDERKTYVTRSSRHVSGWEPVQLLASPPKTVQYFRLEGEGSAGPLDLFADVTVDGKTKDGSYHTQVRPKLSLRTSKKPAKSGGTIVTVGVTDAGDPVPGAKVKGLPGGTKTADAKGTVTATFPKGKAGAFTLTATKPGYVAATGRVSV